MKKHGFIFLIFIILISCGIKEYPSESRFALGAPLTIKVFERISKKKIDLIFNRITQIEQTMSTSAKDYKSTELLDINNASVDALQKGDSGIRRYSISPDTYFVIQKSLQIAELTDSAFDPTIYPLVRLWGFGSESYKIPTKKEIYEILPLINWQTLSVEEGKYMRLSAGQGVDVGGIAKGFASDVAVTMLRDMGITYALIDFGGNIRTLGNTKKDGTQWKIGIQKPYSDIGDIVGIVSVGETSVVSSGVYERYFNKDGKQYFHLLNKKTGYPARNELLSVTIIKKSGIESDGLSTGVFVLGLIRGMALVERLSNTEAVFITRDKKILITSGLIDSFTLTDKEYGMGVAPLK